MLIVPAEQGIDWRHPPWITVVLILLNCLVYYAVQAGDGQRLLDAETGYLNSALPAIEFPAYVDHLRARNDTRALAEWKQGQQSPWAGFRHLAQMQADAPFMTSLRAGQVIGPAHPRHRAWQADRSRYESRLRRVVSRHYALDAARPVTWVTSMFLHAGFSHLLGNMVFLFLAGFAVERILGHGWYLLGYLLGGVGAALLWGWYSDLPAVGASGAVSAVMGLYAVLFGRRRIRVFYWVGIFFNFTRVPAWLLLPAWLATELHGELSGGSSIAYVAHMGGFLAGGLYAWCCKSVLGVARTDILDARARREARDTAFEKAMSYIDALDTEGARRELEALYRADPTDFDVLRQRYRLERRHPAGADFHRVAARLFRAQPKDTTHVADLHDVFLDYCERARPTPAFSANRLVHLADLFRRTGHLDASVEAVILLLRRTPDDERLPRLLDALRPWLATDSDSSRDLRARIHRASQASSSPTNE